MVSRTKCRNPTSKKDESGCGRSALKDKKRELKPDDMVTKRHALEARPN